MRGYSGDRIKEANEVSFLVIHRDRSAFNVFLFFIVSFNDGRGITN